MALDELRGWVGLLLGLLAIALGLIPLLAGLGVIGFNLPEFLLGIMTTFMLYFILAIAVLLFIDAIWADDMLQIVSMVIAVIIFAAGLIPILHSFGVLPFTIPISQTIVSILLIIEGILLAIVAAVMV
ncbi:hypothetical protein CMO92_04860 [Candidatus Woesearchaeota archaeon]|nr:hypothetical protein [Candidatus Woesearchaeota archaeon]|tara:strand:- start:258 stop:641 length:384 start_codon:yes stop_codon:yes gene_type:complete